MRELLPSTPLMTHELRALGIPHQRISELARQGVLTRVFRGVYCPSELELTPELRAACAAKVLPLHAVLSDHAAAWVHGIECSTPGYLGTCPDLEVVSISGHERSRRSGLYGGKRQLRLDEICEIGGIPVTTPVRTACDLACLRGRSRALAALDSTMRVCGVTRADLRRQLRRFGGRRGVVQARELVEHATPKSESPGESWTRMAIIDAGLPVPQPQVWVRLRGHGPVRLDLAYRPWKILIEYNGEEFHTAEEDVQADADRIAALERAGWIVIVVTKDSFTAEELDRWLGEVRSAIAARRTERRYSRAERPGRRPF